MIYLISTYPPKACGIAVFSQNFFSSLQKKSDLVTAEGSVEKFGVLAMVDEGDEDEYGKEVIYKITKNDQKDYLQAADFVNVNKPSICVIEHEFGIFGGEEGYFILSFLNRIKVKTVVVFHTIVQNPSNHQRLIIKELSKHSQRVVVMSEFGMNYLEKIYGVSPDKIAYIPHGVPDFRSRGGKQVFSKVSGAPGRLLVTFGLLSRNKGLETAIRAMKGIVKEFPDTRYLIIGKTHPEVVKRNGEEYRNFLIDLVEKNKLEKNVFFINSFLDEEQIIEYVKAADIYVTPYQDPNQITSGTLSYAIGSGTPFISTPYRYAEEKAQYGCGALFPFYDDQEMAKAVVELFRRPEKLEKMKSKCEEVREAMSWGNVASEYFTLFKKIEDEPHASVTEDSEEEYKVNLSWMPNMKLDHVYRLTDHTGIIQHARYMVPRFEDGYCVDDNARALLLMVMAHRVKKDPVHTEKICTYLAFIDYMVNSNGTIRNFLSFDRKFLDEFGSDDSYGRTLWALGYLMVYPPMGYFRDIGEDLFIRMKGYLPEFIERSSIRGIANSMIGLCYYLTAYPGDDEMIGLLKKMADQLLDTYRNHRKDNWEWFEEKMSYDNAILPLALIRAHDLLGSKECLEVGLKTAAFLEDKMLIDDYYRPIGNSEWYHRDHESPSDYDQQPIEIMAMTWLNYHAFCQTKDIAFLKNIRKGFRWFLGDNTVGIGLYDYETNGCCDGLERGAINRNQGAESTLSFWISYCLVFLSVELESEYLK